MTQHTGGDAIADALKELGVRHVFAIASVHNLPMLDAIRLRTEIIIVNMRHEQATVHAADAYHRSTGRLGVAITSTGPGAANAMGGLFEAVSACASVLMITGQNERRYALRRSGSLHDAPRQTEMLASISRATWMLDVPDQARDVIVSAGARALGAVPGPVVVEVPIDVQYGPSTPGLPGVDAVASPSSTINAGAIRRARELLVGAERPLLIAGGGVVRAGAATELVQLAEWLNAPTLTSIEGRGSIPETHRLAMGATATSASMRELIADSDLVLAVGTHFREGFTGRWTLPLPARLIHIDIDPGMLGLNYPAEVAIVGDAGAALTELLKCLEGQPVPARGAWLVKASGAARSTRRNLLDRIGPDHQSIMETIRSVLPASAPIVRDSTVPAYAWGDVLLPILVPGTSIRSASAAIGPGLPLAIGAAVGTGERTVAICGDGGILLSIGELAVLSQFDLPVTVCVFNDNCYGVLKGIQAATFDGGPADVDLNAPDFVALAHSFGLTASLATSADEFREQFTEVAEQPGPHLIEVDLGSLEPIVLPYVSGAPEQV